MYNSMLKIFIAILFSLLTIYLVSIFIPAPEYNIPYFDYHTIENIDECYDIGGEWITSIDYGNYCSTEKLFEEYQENYWQEYDLNILNKGIIFGIIAVIIIFISIIYLKNEIFSHGLIGSGLLLLTYNGLSYYNNPELSAISAFIGLTFLVYLGINLHKTVLPVKKIKKKK
jgi:hypothetical protein